MLRLVLILILMHLLFPSFALGAANVAKSALELIREEEADRPAKAVEDYADFIVSHSPPLSKDEIVDVAIAFFNRGIVLTRLQRVKEAKRSYLALEDGFAKSDIRIVKLQVAKGLVNLAFLNLEDGHYKDAIAFAQTVDKRYSGANDGQLGEDGFDVQVVKALNDRADALDRLGMHPAAIATCEATLKRFRTAKGEKMKLALDVTRDLRRKFGTLPSNFGLAPIGK